MALKEKTQLGKNSSKSTSMTKLVGLLMSKFCHDITNPINATHCAIEILDSEKSSIDKKREGLAMSIALDSANDMIDRLKFLRNSYAYMTGNKPENIKECYQELFSYLKKKRILLAWDHNKAMEGGVSINFDIKQMLYNTIVAIQESLAYIKELTIDTYYEDMDLVLNIVAESNQEKVIHVRKVDYVDIIREGITIEELSMENSQCFFAHLLLSKLACKTKFSCTEKKVKFEIRCNRSSVLIA